MDNVKRIFKFYPDKTKKPNLKGVLFGALYDFGWIFVLGLFGVSYTLFKSDIKEIFAQNLKFGLIVLVSILVQIVILEAVIWWISFLLKKRR